MPLKHQSARIALHHLPRNFIITSLLIFFGNFSLLAQTRPVTGKVVANENGTELAGATVKVKGSGVTTVTAADGTFTINAGPRDVLTITSL